MAKSVVISLRQRWQNGRWKPRFGMRIRRIVNGKGSPRRLAITSTFALLCLTNTAQAGTGYELLRQCEIGEDSNNPVHYQASAYCAGFIYGVSNGADTALAIQNSAPLFCYPQQIPQVGQLTLVYIDWAHHNPQYLSRDAGVAILAALSATFPCRR